MSVAVNIVDHDVAGQITRRADGHPAPTSVRIETELLDRERLVVRDRCQSDAAERGRWTSRKPNADRGRRKGNRLRNISHSVPDGLGR